MYIFILKMKILPYLDIIFICQSKYWQHSDMRQRNRSCVEVLEKISKLGQALLQLMKSNDALCTLTPLRLGEHHLRENMRIEW